MENNTARQRLLNILGDKENSAGSAVVDFVSERLEGVVDKIDALITEYNETNKQALALKADKADIDEMNGRLAAAAAALTGAVTARDTAKQSVRVNPASAKGSVDQAEAVTDQAAKAVSNATLTLESLNERVENLEDWRTNTVNPTLAQHRRWIEELQQNAGLTPSGDQPATAEEHVVSQSVHPPTQVQPTVERRLEEREVVRTHFMDRTVDIRHWSGMQWACALILAIVFMFWLGPIFSEWARSVLQGHAWDWVTNVMRFLGWIIALAIGFCLGGVIGTLLDNAINSSSSAARREEREYHGHHVAHDNGHHNVRADELTHAR